MDSLGVLCGELKLRVTQGPFSIYRNFSLLSFGDEAEEDEEEITVVSKVHLGVPDLNTTQRVDEIVDYSLPTPLPSSPSPSFRTGRLRVAMTC